MIVSSAKALIESSTDSLGTQTSVSSGNPKYGQRGASQGSQYIAW